MKKKILPVLLSVLLIVIIFSGCASKMEKYSAYISECRSNVYEISSEAMRVSAITGIREEPYLIDGHCSGTVDFTVITIEPAEYNSDTVYNYIADIDGVKFEGVLNQHPFGKSYSVDLRAKCVSDNIQFSVSSDNYNENFTIVSVKASNMINESKALDIAAKKLKKSISGLESNKRLNAEIYIRLMANPIDSKGGYHWYVAFISDSNTVYAVLIEPVTMEIVAIRN